MQAEILPDDAVDDASVEALEAALKSNGDDHEIRKNLAYALLERYLNGSETFDSGSKKDLKRVRELLVQLPDGIGLLPRAYIAFVDKQYEKAADYLGQHAEFIAADDVLSAERLFEDFVTPFYPAPASFWSRLSERLLSSLPRSAAGHLFAGLDCDARRDKDGEVGAYLAALHAEPECWLAASYLAGIYLNESNYESAIRFYRQALEHNPDDADLHYWSAVCYTHLKRYSEAVEEYEKCLAIDETYDSARNGMGWKLYRLGRYEDALRAFDECIRLGIDGKYPLRNRARSLEKLGRYEEALEQFRAVAGEKPNKDDSKKIAQLEAKVKNAGQASNGTDDEVDDEEDEGQPPPAKPAQPSKGKKEISPERMSSQKEHVLEELIEERIKRGLEVFGRRLRLYRSADGLTGRQFPVGTLGRIDLLTEDCDNGELVVIELKRDEGHDVVVGQISMYLGWVKEHIAQPGQNVVGIICVLEASDKLKFAAKHWNIAVFEYMLSFQRV